MSRDQQTLTLFQVAQPSSLLSVNTQTVPRGREPGKRHPRTKGGLTRGLRHRSKEVMKMMEAKEQRGGVPTRVSRSPGCINRDTVSKQREARVLLYLLCSLHGSQASSDVLRRHW